MAITDWPLNERPREKLLQQGATSLSDAELLAIFLRTGIKGKTAVDLARELLEKFKGLRKLLEASPRQFCQAPGLGQAKFALLQAVLEMARRHLYEELAAKEVLHNSAETKLYFAAKLRHQSREVFACLFLDNQHRILAYEELFHGSINQAHIHPREVVKRSLYHNAAAVILAHNHPSGSVKPSQDDQEITQSLMTALKLVDVRVLDHLIIGESRVVSFVELGLLG